VKLSHADVDKLRNMRAPGPVVLSLYLPVPLDPAGMRSLAARAGQRMAAASEPGDVSAVRVSHSDRNSVLDTLAAHGRDWLGHTVAIFACGELGLLEALPLPCWLPERAVLTTRPHVRPLLAALQRCPPYHVAVVDRRQAWVLSLSGDQVETVARSTAEVPRSSGFGGWYGLKAYRVQQRIIRQARQHYRDTAAILERATGKRDPQPLVIGGHEDSIRHLLRALPPGAREAFAGSFTADPHALTPARVRELANPVIQSWAARRERRLTEEILRTSPVRLAAIGLPSCLAAVNAGAVALLLVPDDPMIPGFECGRCGGLSATGDGCPDWGTAARAVPDLLEEMTLRTLDGGGQVAAVREAPVSAAAKLRFPVTDGGTGR
jgi:peptide chain release factor subunit 1